MPKPFLILITGFLPGIFQLAKAGKDDQNKTAESEKNRSKKVKR